MPIPHAGAYMIHEFPDATGRTRVTTHMGEHSAEEWVLAHAFEIKQAWIKKQPEALDGAELLHWRPYEDSPGGEAVVRTAYDAASKKTRREWMRDHLNDIRASYETHPLPQIAQPVPA